METIGERLEKILKDRGINGSSASKLCGVPAPRIYNLINGTTTNPETETVKKIAKGLGIDETYLLTGKSTLHGEVKEAILSYQGKQISINQDEFLLLCTFRDLPETEQKEILREIHLVWAQSKGAL